MFFEELPIQETHGEILGRDAVNADLGFDPVGDLAFDAGGAVLAVRLADRIDLVAVEADLGERADRGEEDPHFDRGLDGPGIVAAVLGGTFHGSPGIAARGIADTGEKILRFPFFRRQGIVFRGREDQGTEQSGDQEGETESFHLAVPFRTVFFRGAAAFFFTGAFGGLASMILSTWEIPETKVNLTCRRTWSVSHCFL